MLIHRELLRANLFLQSRGIGALQKKPNIYVRKKSNFLKKPTRIEITATKTKSLGNHLLPLKISLLCLLCSSELNEYDALLI